jgi:chromate transporter
MNAGLVWQLTLSFLGVAFLSIGGASALIPEFYRQVVDVHAWMSSTDFAHTVALAQIAPGPNMLIVSLIGWKVAGIAGLLACTLAIVGPPSVLAFAVGRMTEKLGEKKWLSAVKKALAPCVVGLTLASGLITARAADNDWIGVVLTLGAAAFMYFLRRNPLWVIGAGAFVGIFAYRVGLMHVV